MKRQHKSNDATTPHWDGPRTGTEMPPAYSVFLCVSTASKQLTVSSVPAQARAAFQEVRWAWPAEAVGIGKLVLQLIVRGLPR